MQFHQPWAFLPRPTQWTATGAFMRATKPVASKNFSAEPRLHAKPEYEKVGDGYAVNRDLAASRSRHGHFYLIDRAGGLHYHG